MDLGTDQARSIGHLLSVTPSTSQEQVSRDHHTAGPRDSREALPLLKSAGSQSEVLLAARDHLHDVATIGLLGPGTARPRTSEESLGSVEDTGAVCVMGAERALSYLHSGRLSFQSDLLSHEQQLAGSRLAPLILFCRDPGAAMRGRDVPEDRTPGRVVHHGTAIVKPLPGDGEARAQAAMGIVLELADQVPIVI